MYKRSAFTLIEMLVVIAIIIILAGMVLAGITVVNKKKSEVITVTFMKQLEVAIGQYQQIYSFLPFTLSAGTTTDYLVNDPNNDGNLADSKYDELLRTLEGQDATLNPRKQKFLELDKNSEYNDGWSNPFRVALDLEYDDDLESAYIWGDGKINRNIAIWSAGRDEQDSATDADLSNDDNKKSWDSN